MTGRPLTGPLSGMTVVPLRSLFSPLALVVWLYAPLLLLYALSSESVFLNEFDSRKTLTWAGFAYFALALGLFAAGAKLGQEAVRRPRFRASTGQDTLSPRQKRRLEKLLEAALAVSILAYVVWFARGAVRAGGALSFLETWRRDPHLIKTEIMTTVPGVTTLTQLALATVPLAIAYGLTKRRSLVRTLVVVVLALAVLRAVFVSERLALIELLVPLAFLLAAPRKVAFPRIAVYALAFVAAVMTFFAVTELRRTYVYTQDFSPAEASTRFFGYYLTSINNGMVIVDRYPARTPFYSTGKIAWEFPVVRDVHVEQLPVVGTLSFRYEDALGVDPEDFWLGAFVVEGLDHEFNVFTTPGYLAADFGWAGLVVMLVLGVLSGRIYCRSETSPFHRALYAVWLVGLLELMRIYYLAETRVFPAYLVFLAAYLVVRPRAADSARQTTVGPAQSESRAVG